MSAPAEPILRVHRCAKFFGAKLVFKNVNCQLHPGEVLLVAGGNGAGKTTLVKLMAGLSKPSAGSVEWSLPPQDLAYLGHSTFLYPGLTARANLLFWAGMYGIKPTKGELDIVLEQVDLLRVAEEKAGGFSRGMAQRLNLARIFLVQPRLLFLDEPATGLDARSLVMLHDAIATQSARGAGIVWVSHHLHDDVAKADAVLYLADNAVAYSGAASEFDLGRLAC